jgi:hypothetical protein
MVTKIRKYDLDMNGDPCDFCKEGSTQNFAKKMPKKLSKVVTIVIPVHPFVSLAVAEVCLREFKPIPHTFDDEDEKQRKMSGSTAKAS